MAQEPYRRCGGQSWQKVVLTIKMCGWTRLSINQKAPLLHCPTRLLLLVHAIHIEQRRSIDHLTLTVL